MNTLIALTETTVAIQNSDNQGYQWPAILIGVACLIFIVVFFIIEVRKPTTYQKKVERWNLGIADREKEHENINKKLNGKSFIVTFREPDRKVSWMESSLIELLTNAGAKVIRINKEEGDKTLFDSKYYDPTYLIVTGITRVIQAEGCLKKFSLDLRIWQHDPVVTGADIYLKAINITEEHTEWVMFDCLRNIGNTCSD